MGFPSSFDFLLYLVVGPIYLGWTMRGKHFGNEMRDEIDAVVHQIRFLMVQFMKDTVFRDLFWIICIWVCYILDYIWFSVFFLLPSLEITHDFTPNYPWILGRWGNGQESAGSIFSPEFLSREPFWIYSRSCFF